MQYYECRCGLSTAFGSMGPYECDECEKCHSRLLHVSYKRTMGPTDEAWKPRPHQWVRQYNRDTGEPYEVCSRCDIRKEPPLSGLGLKDGDRVIVTQGGTLSHTGDKGVITRVYCPEAAYVILDRDFPLRVEISIPVSNLRKDES